MKEIELIIVVISLYITIETLMEDVLKVKEYWKYAFVFYTLGMVIGVVKARIG